MNKKNLTYILIGIVIIIVIVVLFSSSSTLVESQEDKQKKQDIDNTFAIWVNVAGKGDQQTLTENEASIKKDLFDKLNIQEVDAVKKYSIAIQDLMSVKDKPLNPLFITSIAYLTSNFNSIKEIVSKTNVSNIFGNFGIASNFRNNNNI